MNKLLPFAVMAVLSSAAARAEDPVQTAPPVAPAAAAPATPPATAPAKPEEKPASCDDTLGVSRVAEVDTAGGALFGDQYPPTTLLQKGEVVLTFDDGPLPTFTKPILAALDEYCTKATFFNVGEMVMAYPDMVKQVQARGHTVGTHTWSHPMYLPGLGLDDRRRHQIETRFRRRRAGFRQQPIAPFFRFPGLSDSPTCSPTCRSAASPPSPSTSFRSTATTAARRDRRQRAHWPSRDQNGGIILFHDINASTAKALPTVLKELKSHGFKVVHLVPKSHVEVIAQTEPPKAEALHGGTHHRAHYVKRRRYAKR